MSLLSYFQRPCGLLPSYLLLCNKPPQSSFIIVSRDSWNGRGLVGHSWLALLRWLLRAPGPDAVTVPGAGCLQWPAGLEPQLRRQGGLSCRQPVHTAREVFLALGGVAAPPQLGFALQAHVLQESKADAVSLLVKQA